MPADIASLRDELRASYETPAALAAYAARAGQGLRAWESSVVERFFPERGAVLVVGCGAGRESFALDAIGYRVTGVDVAPGMIAAAKARDAGRRCDFRLTDGGALPFEDASFDAVTLWSQVISNIPTARERARFMGEVARVLRPGGVVSLSAHDAALTLAELPPERLIARDDPEPGDVTIREVDEGADRCMHYFTEPELRALCAGAGLDLRLLAHTDMLGERWGNVFVLVGVAAA